MISPQVLDDLTPEQKEIWRRYEPQLRASAAAGLLEDLRRDFVDLRDPIAPWRAWFYCRQGDWPLPTWVLEHFDHAAIQITRWPRMPPSGDVTTAVGEVLGFGSRKPGENPVTRTRQRDEAWIYFSHYVRALEDGCSPQAAREWVADQLGSSESTVRRRLKWFADRQGSTVDALAKDRREELLSAYRSASWRLAELKRRAALARRHGATRADG